MVVVYDGMDEELNSPNETSDFKNKATVIAKGQGVDQKG